MAGQFVNGAATLYFAGGTYEVSLDINGSATTTRKYYSIAGQMVAKDNGSSLQYILTDQLGPCGSRGFSEADSRNQPGRGPGIVIQS
jgi:hypothetical protein